MFFADEIIFKVSLASRRFINISHDAFKIFIESAPDNFFIDKQKVCFGEVVIILGGVFGEIFMASVEVFEVIGFERGKNFFKRVARRAVRQDTQRRVNPVRRVENIFVTIESREVFPTKFVDTR